MTRRGQRNHTLRSSLAAAADSSLRPAARYEGVPMSDIRSLKVKLFADGADLDGMMEMYASR